MNRKKVVSAACGGLVLVACAGGPPVAGDPGRVSEGAGAVSQVSIDETAHYETVADLIRGQVPGVEVIQGSGRDFTLRIRGMRPLPGGLVSTSASDSTGAEERGMGAGATYTSPLLVIDGMSITPGNNSRALNAIQPSDVESITVHKDASSTVIWGTRGANGVIEVKTKQGR